MTINGASGSSFEGAYGGFSASEPPPTRAHERLDIPRPETRMYAPHEYRRRAPTRRRLGVVVAGVLAALGAGLAFGYLSRVDLRPAPEPPPPPDVSALTDTPSAAAPVSSEEIARIALGEGEPARPAAVAKPVVVETPKPAPVVRRVVAAPPKVQPAPVQRLAPPPPRRIVAAAPPAPVVRALPAPVQSADVERRSFRPAFHCDWRLRPSEAMVCGDAQLSAYDRELNRAFNRAVQAGAPRGWLREEQDEWVMVDRERAARRGGPEAVAEAYRRRIAELQSLYD